MANDDYYHYLLENSELKNSLHIAKTEALICLKAKAYLEIASRIEGGSKEESKKLRKHKGDVFRLAVMLTEENIFKLPEPIKSDLQEFVDTINRNLPPISIFKEMGLSNISIEKMFNQIIKIFQLKENK
jgi:hypothetical protein